MSGFYTNGVPAPSTTNGAFPFTGSETIPMDTNNARGVGPETVGATLSQLASYLSGDVPWVTGRFYGLPKGATPVAVLTVASTLYAYPVYVPNTATVSTLNIGVTTGQTGGAAHVGIYADNGSGYPGDLVYDSGAVSGLTSTTVVTKSSVATTLQAGLYWIATIFTASSTFPSVSAITANYGCALNAMLGSDTAAHMLATSGEAATGISVAGTYGALPATFTAGATLTLNAATPVISIGV